MTRILIWGTGQIAKEVLNDCKTLDEYEILGFVDNDVEKQGRIFWGKTIYSPKEIKDIKPDAIVVFASAYEEIKEQIIDIYPDMCGEIHNQYYFYKQSIIKRYEKNDDCEIQEVMSFLNHNDLDVFNYNFKYKYEDVPAEAIYDEVYDLYYVYHNQKKMYLSKKYNTKHKSEEYYKSLLIEQDEESPHRYIVKGYSVENGDVVVDVGAAEGIFTLDIIDIASKVYILEADKDWIEALKITFKDYMDKIVIIEGFFSSYNEGRYRTIDSCIKEPVNYIKMDIEGNEWDALRGTKNLVSISKELSFAICSYHSDFDQILIESYFDSLNIEHITSKGYMWFPWKVRQNYVSTSLNRGLVRAQKS